MGKHPPKSLGLKRALVLMAQPGHRLMKMCQPKLPEGYAFYVVPGGYIEPSDAHKIIERPDVFVYDDGIFPGIPQSWRLGLAGSLRTPGEGK